MIKGINRRVTIGFAFLVGLLFASSWVSLYELGNVSTDLESILNANRRNVELTKEMSFRARMHSQALLHFAVESDSSYIQVCRQVVDEFEKLLEDARRLRTDGSLDSLKMALEDLSLTSECLFRETVIVDSLDERFVEKTELVQQCMRNKRRMMGIDYCSESYEPVLMVLADRLSNYISQSYLKLSPRAEQLNRNSYRAVTPVFVTLLVMVAVVLMFYFFIRVYCVNPVVKLDKALSNYLRYKIPFSVKANLQDEMRSIVDQIETLISKHQTQR